MVELLRKNGDEEVAGQGPEPLPPFPPKKKIILIVDDDPISRKMIKSFLVAARFDVMEAGDAAECLKKLATNPEIDLGLMDIEMPNINGIQLIKIIQKQAAYIDLPFIMVTSMSDKEHVFQSIKAGAKDYLVKPFDQKTLLAKISKYLNNEEDKTNG